MRGKHWEEMQGHEKKKVAINITGTTQLFKLVFPRQFQPKDFRVKIPIRLPLNCEVITNFE